MSAKDPIFIVGETRRMILQEIGDGGASIGKPQEFRVTCERPQKLAPLFVEGQKMWQSKSGVFFRELPDNGHRIGCLCE